MATRNIVQVGDDVLRKKSLPVSEINGKIAELLDDMKETLKKAESGAVIIDNKLLHNMPIRGGRAIWVEDISELIEVRESLELTQDELKDRNDFLQYSYKKEEENKVVEEQNRLYPWRKPVLCRFYP